MNPARFCHRLIVVELFAVACALLPATCAVATVYDFAADGEEYSGNILGQNPLFVPGGLRTLPEFNDLYQTSNGFIVDEFIVGSGNPVDFRMTDGSFTNWENGSPTVASWVNARDGFKFPAGSRLGGEFSGSFSVGEIITLRAFEFPIGSGLHTELNRLPVIDEVSMTVGTEGESLPFLFESLSGDARSFAAHRTTTAGGDYVISPIGMSTNSIELTTVADNNPPAFPHSPTQFDFANVGVTYAIDAFQLDDAGQEALDSVNAAFDSSNGFHDEEFEIFRPDIEGAGGFNVGGGSTNGYADRWLNMGGTENHLKFWVNAKEGHMFPEDAAIGVTRFNPGWTPFDNNGNPVEVVIRAYAERIETGSFDELENLTVVGEASGVGFGTFNTPPALELMAAARSFTVNTGDGNGNFFNFQREDGFANITLNQIIVDTVPEPDVGLIGDYNGDDVVDAADYTVWRDTLGSMTDLRADGDDSGTIDGPDYTAWVNHFGETAAMGLSAGNLATSVPEPGILPMLAVAMALSTLSLRCRR